MTRTFARTVVFLAALVQVGLSRGGEPLPSDARVKTGKLANGLTWLYRQHDNPPGKMAVLIHVDTGSLNETDEQRGLAHFLEHMAFNGSENFPPGKLIPYFESIGMEFGADLNAYTSFDQTVYMLYLPDTTTEQMDKALMVLSDYAFRLSLLQEEVEKERGVILSELRAGMSAQQRIRDQLFEKLFAGTRLGQRLPIGLEKVIRAVTPADFQSYYRTWYRPERVTLIMVGDSAPEPYLPLIEKWFGQYQPTGQAQPEMGPELKPFTQPRAMVLSDPEYAQGDVDIYNISPGRPPTTTVEQARVDLIERIGSWIIGRRFSERIKKGQAAYREASAQVRNFFNDAMLANASATGEPKDWEKLLEQLIIEVNRAREHAFLPGEFELCKAELLSSAEDRVRKESTRNARRMLMQMASAVNDREPIMSAEQELELLKRLLPTIKLEEVTTAFVQHFRPETFAYVLTMPQEADLKLPTEEEVLAAARAAQARQAEPPPDVKLGAQLIEKEPTPGKLVESTTDPDLAITSGWLTNGVRVHHRFMDYKKDLILLTIALAGGQIEETAENAGVTEVASLVFDQPATKRLDSTEIEDLMTGKNIRVRGRAEDDTLAVTVSGSPKDLEIGLQLAHALLTEGKIESSAFDNWKQQSLQRYAQASKLPQFAAFDAWAKAVSGNDPRRVVLMTPEQIEAQNVDRSQAWLERLCLKAPIEVAAVGEMQLEEVLPLIEKYIGSLPERPRAAAHLDPLRKFNRQPGPLERSVSVDTITPQAWVIFGFMSCNATDVVDLRALNLAANILDSRLIKRVREELGLVYSIGARQRPQPAYDDSGIFMSGAPCAPDRPEEVTREVSALYQAMADSGPTAEELENAKKQILNHLDTQLREPSYWSNQLQSLDLHKLKLENLKNIPEAYQAFTPEQVQEAFKKYCVPRRIFQIIAVPTQVKTETQPEAAQTQPVPPAP
jgi:zinc protease